MSSLTTKRNSFCYNLNCKGDATAPEEQQKHIKRAWRLHNGDFAHLCLPCSAAFEEGKFCETFHLDAAGWRNCDSCGKRVHCGCIVSINAYLLLDAGGVECMPCAWKNIIMAPNQIWPSSSSLSLSQSNRHNNLSVKNWNQSAGPCAISGHRQQQLNMLNTSSVPSDLNPTMQYDVDGLKKISRDYSAPDLEKKSLGDPFDRVNNCNLSVMNNLTNGNGAVDMLAASHSLRWDEMSLNNLQGTTYTASSSSKEDQSIARMPYPLRDGANVPEEVSLNQSQRQSLSTSMANQSNANIQTGTKSSGESQVRVRRNPVDPRGRSQLLPRYWPKIIDPELQKISEASNSVITPLFEKTLSASDAGRIGRLVLPKRCAEAYFPAISQSEGIPLKVQDAKGKEWVLHFRFWPNNNSRMYVLEGVTPCIQSMQLQAGDTVTFSRIDPGGKLAIGCRKAERIPPSDQDKLSLKTVGDVSKISEVNEADPAVSWPENGKSGYVSKEVAGSKSRPRKRRGSSLGFKSKRLSIDNEDLIELKLTWEEAQGLLRPPPDYVPNVMVVEGHEFEEYEEAPLLGKPTIFSTDQVGEMFQWAQCEDCSKWRKVPNNVVLPFRWNCSANLWDSKRSSCSSAQEAKPKQLEDVFSSRKTVSASKKTKAMKKDMDAVKVSEGLNTPGEHSPILEGDVLPSVKTTTRHPRHRFGCTCIVCIQSPSGKGLKHKDSCKCNVCLTVRRRRLSLLKHFSEKDMESAREKLEQLKLPNNPTMKDDVQKVVYSVSASKKTKAMKKDMDAVKVSEGLNTPGEHSPILEGDVLPSVKTTTRHPRHRFGCTCIVCIQSPSGKGLKHKDSCKCNVCLTVRRRRLSLLKHFSEKDMESAREKLEQLKLPNNPTMKDDVQKVVYSGGADSMPKLMASENSNDFPQEKPSSPIGQIDLNIQLEREDGPSSISGSGNMVRLQSGTHKLYPLLHGSTGLSGDGDLALNERQPSEGGCGGNGARGELGSGVQHASSPGASKDSPIPRCISMSVIVPTSS
ncbi:B3 domain-containing protein [Thalictrum thalictroides]|uniref:B3 domain-containing protein n=1 Tax=Thalictrum thalictroides TaxID=46969 RepID=A0A7J6W9L3_THATH|nr:B3 domain-containing protein [Thalictrum thalictroides]